MSAESFIKTVDENLSSRKTGFFCYVPPEGKAIAGVLNQNGKSEYSLALRFFTNEPQNNSIWKDFSQGNFPIQILADCEAGELAQALAILPQPEVLSPFTWQESREEWATKFSKAQEFFSSGGKIVLARYRHTEVPLSGAVTNNILTRLVQKSAKNTHKFILAQGQSVFLGATPELLFERKNGTIFIPAIAGTRLLTKDSEFAKKSEELLKSAKDLAEHRFVVQDILEKAKSLQLQLMGKLSEPKILRLGQLLHLHTPMRFTELGEKTISNLLVRDTLHPTAAIGGHPSKLAHQFLQQKEPWRGLYSAPLLIVMPETSICLVAIRSAVVCPPHLFQFAGAGITKESDVLLEWEETTAKMNTLSRLWFS